VQIHKNICVSFILSSFCSSFLPLCEVAAQQSTPWMETVTARPYAHRCPACSCHLLDIELIYPHIVVLTPRIFGTVAVFHQSTHHKTNPDKCNMVFVLNCASVFCTRKGVHQPSCQFHASPCLHFGSRTARPGS
jgi:hypothetical protein